MYAAGIITVYTVQFVFVSWLSGYSRTPYCEHVITIKPAYSETGASHLLLMIKSL